jgi:periplasmic protein TonB
MATEFLNKWDAPESDDRLNLVFEDRFKGYGAYFIRKNYRKSKFIATVIACVFIVVVSAMPVIIEKFSGAKDSGSTKVRVEAKTLDDVEKEKEEEKPIEPPKPDKPEPIATQQFVPPRIDPNATKEDDLPPLSLIKSPGAKYQDGKDDPWNGDDGAGGEDPFKGGKEEEPKTKVDVAAQFPGGEAAFIQYVQDHFQYPPRCQEEGISGYVLLRFVVDVDGKISRISPVEVTKSCTEFTDEAIKVLKKSPRWIAAQYNGKFVKAWRQIPISLKLD